MVGLDDFDRVVQTHVSEYFFPEDQAFMMEQFFPKVLRDGHCEPNSLPELQDGEPLWTIYSVFTLTDSAGQPVASPRSAGTSVNASKVRKSGSLIVKSWPMYCA